MFSQTRRLAVPGRRAGLATRLMAALSLGRQRRALEQLDDSLLDDIGLTRADAALEAARAAWDVPANWRR